MTDFLEISLTELNTDVVNSEFNTFCICCLTKNAKLVKLRNCTHTRFLDDIIGKEIAESNAICINCHKCLVNIEKFRLQVESNVASLQQAKEHRQLPEKAFNLQRTVIELTSTEGSQTATESQTFDIKIKIENDYDADGDIDAKDFSNIKNEAGQSSDGEIDVPLSNLKKETVSKLRTRKKTLKRGNIPKSLYDGKITVITISNKELMEERKADRLKEAFLKLPYRCEHCIVGFDHELTAQEHMEKRHTEKKGSFTCKVCRSVLNTASSYREHCKRHYRRYECACCGKRNNTVHAVIKHINKQHGGDIKLQFECQECGFVCKSDRGYRYHREKHNYQQKVQCSECGNSYVNKNALRVHMYQIHKFANHTFSCDKCSKTYSTKSGLLAHKESTHEVSTAYCEMCKTHFTTKTSLRTHLRTHSNHVQDHEKRFQCNICDAKFVRKANLREHIDFTHLNNIKHECTECNKKFRNAATLRKHNKYVHEKKRPPRNKICDHCGRGFTTLAILHSHVRTHTGERPFKCRHCASTFAHSAALYTHNKLLHSGAKA